MHALSIKDLKKYKSGVEALKSVSFDVQEGDFFALLGPNGAGKTTAIGIITSLVNKSSGSIEVFGNDLDKELAKANLASALCHKSESESFLITTLIFWLIRQGFTASQEAKERRELNSI